MYIPCTSKYLPPLYLSSYACPSLLPHSHRATTLPTLFHILYPLESTFQKKNAPYMCIWRPVDFTNSDISSPIYFPMKILSLYDWIKSQWVYRSHFLYPFICWLPCQFSCMDIMTFYNYISIALLDTDSIVTKYSLSD